MSHAHDETVTVTTTAATGTASSTAASRTLKSIHYTVDGTAPYTGTPLIKVTVAKTGEVIVNDVDISGGSRVFRPRMPSHDTAGAANAADFVSVSVPGSPLTFEISGADAGGGETGSFLIVWGDT